MIVSLCFSVWEILAQLIVLFQWFISFGLSLFIRLYPFVIIVYEASHILNLTMILSFLLFWVQCRRWIVSTGDIHKFALSLYYTIFFVCQILQPIQVANILIELSLLFLVDGGNGIRVIIECGPVFHRVARLAQSCLSFLINGSLNDIWEEMRDESNWFL